jgi:beta-N-acetylglucosaminidase
MILDEIQESKEMQALWKNYQSKFDYAADIKWNDIIQSTKKLYSMIDTIKEKRREAFER